MYNTNNSLVPFQFGGLFVIFLLTFFVFLLLSYLFVLDGLGSVLILSMPFPLYN